MARKGVLRPRILSAIFGGYVLVIVIFAWYFATGPGSGYVYGPDLTRWVYMTYMLVAAALLSGIAAVSVGSARRLDRLIDEAESGGEFGDDLPERETIGPEEPEALPPPLREAPAGKDHVDQDIDELLVSLQEIETSADQTEEYVVEEVAAEPLPVRRLTSAGNWRAASNLERWKARRAEVPSYFAGPALLVIGILGICAAMLPGADAMLQTYSQLNTALILGIGYAYGGIAAYAGASVYAMLRKK
ncbi:MAG TPA: hypothetical protein VI999_08135 [Thermoplasmata archaeon]|nr:hypothetical protein [Thermoplasmata archaeon]